MYNIITGHKDYTVFLLHFLNANNLKHIVADPETIGKLSLTSVGTASGS